MNVASHPFLARPPRCTFRARGTDMSPFAEKDRCYNRAKQLLSHSLLATNVSNANEHKNKCDGEIKVIYNFIYNLSLLWRSMLIVAKISRCWSRCNNTCHINHTNRSISFHFLYIHSEYINNETQNCDVKSWCELFCSRSVRKSASSMEWKLAS